MTAIQEAAIPCEVYLAWADGKLLGAYLTEDEGYAAVYRVAQGGRLLRYQLRHAMLLRGETCIRGHEGTLC